MDFHVQNIDSRKAITQWGSCPNETRLREINGSQSVTFLGGSFTGRVVEFTSRALTARFSRYFERVKITHGRKAKEFSILPKKTLPYIPFGGIRNDVQKWKCARSRTFRDLVREFFPKNDTGE